MSLPFFFLENISAGDNIISLNEDTSKHLVQVLRMKIGEKLQLTNGAGNILIAEITDDNRKKTTVKILETKLIPAGEKKITLAVSLVKNNSRFEWLLEKATELGISEIAPLICERTEKQHFRFERMKGILISAMLQSQQVWLPVLHEPIKFKSFVGANRHKQKYIAHCSEDNLQKELKDFRPFNDAVILIGPEGDFSHAEITEALVKEFIPVSLGSTRLRTETAAVASAVIMQLD